MEQTVARVRSLVALMLDQLEHVAALVSNRDGLTDFLATSSAAAALCPPPAPPAPQAPLVEAARPSLPGSGLSSAVASVIHRLSVLRAELAELAVPARLWACRQEVGPHTFILSLTSNKLGQRAVLKRDPDR